jgi:hypothetical protein
MLAASWSDLVYSLLPFVLLIGFWFFLTKQVEGRRAGEGPVLEKLEEIQRELERLRKTIEGRDF